MRNVLSNCLVIRVMVVLACVVLLPTWLCGQDTKNVKSAPAQGEWSESKLKDAGKQLKEVNEWQAEIDKYEKEKARLDSLKTVAGSRKTKLDSLNDQLKDTQNSLQALFADRKGLDWFKQMYQRYDTTLLLQVQERLGDDNAELIVKELLTCHRAETLLSVPYDEHRVDEAINNLGKMDGKGKGGLNNEISSRLRHYSEMAENLRSTLETAQEVSTCGKKEGNTRKTECRNDFLKALDKLDQELLNPKAYPYLHGLLVKAVELKLDDPSNDINEIINLIDAKP